jgi:hypothetical protein
VYKIASISLDYRGGGGEVRLGPRLYALVPGSGEVVVVELPRGISVKEAVAVFGVRNSSNVPGLFLYDVAERWGAAADLKKYLDAGAPPDKALRELSQKYGETAMKYAEALKQVRVYYSSDDRRPDAAYIIAKELGPVAEVVVYLGWRDGGRVYEYEPILLVVDRRTMEVVELRYRQHYAPVSVSRAAAGLLGGFVISVQRGPVDPKNHYVIALPVGNVATNLYDYVKEVLNAGLPAEYPKKNAVGLITPENFGALLKLFENFTTALKSRAASMA